MLRSLDSLKGQPIEAEDGNIGKIHDFFMDEHTWTVRYIVVATGPWLIGRKVLLAPHVVDETAGPADGVRVQLTRDQVKSSPDIDTDKPVSRQRELELHAHYAWPHYWASEAQLMNPMTATPLPRRDDKTRKAQDQHDEGDPHLRSFRAVTGYSVSTRDGEAGRVIDMVSEVPGWIVRYLVIDTGSWLPGRKVLVAPDWRVAGFSWADRALVVDLTQAQIKESPEYDPSEPINREYEERLYDYHGRQVYWSDEDVASRR